MENREMGDDVEAADLAAESAQEYTYPRARYSSGIALCKRGSDGIVRLLLVQKRYTYAFFAFVYHKCNMRDDDAVIALLDRMTIEEKLDILSLDFQRMWWRVWLGRGTSAQFLNAHRRFRETFTGDHGARIQSLVRRSTVCALRLWEMPKGRKKNANEREMDCAIREFYEETGIPRSAYHITRGTHEIDFTEDGIHYHVKYFIAITTRDIHQRITTAKREQVSEICDIHWATGAEMEAYAPRDVPGHRSIIRYAKRALRNPFIRVAHSSS